MTPLASIVHVHSSGGVFGVVCVVAGVLALVVGPFVLVASDSAWRAYMRLRIEEFGEDGGFFGWLYRVTKRIFGEDGE